MGTCAPSEHSEDTFARFLRVLADSMDDPDATGDELARRVHLSRYHFDRIISSVAGEPPGAFRRRVLLERAAYRLVTGSAGIMAVALEAGYHSNESFTRAFQRAYGVSPSRWRSRPGKFQLPAPSGVHFHPPAGLRVPGTQAGAGTDELVVTMVRHHIWLVGELVGRASRLPDTALDAPLPQRVEGIDGDSLRWLLSRLIGQMEMWNAAMDDREYDFSVEPGESCTSMRRRVGRVAPEFLAHVRDAGGRAGFDETFVEAMTEVPVIVTYGGMVAHVLTFAAHHRLLALAVLAEHGIDDLAFGDPKYWVAKAGSLPEAPGR